MSQNINMVKNTVSIIITCHNEEKFITECINSVLNQSAFDLIYEIIVVIDTSTDSSLKIIKSLAQNNPKIKIYEVNYSSLSKSRNYGVYCSSSKYLAFLDGDDYWSTDKLKKQINAFTNLDDEYALIYTNYNDFSDQKLNDFKRVSVRSFNKCKNQLTKYFCKDGPIVPSSILVRSSVIREIGSFDENLKYYEDTDFYLKILEKHKIFHINDFSCFKRRHQNQITNKLYKLIPYGDMVIDKAILRNKNLLKYKKIRQSRNRNKASIHAKIHLNKNEIALKLIKNSLIINPLSFNSWIILIFILFPNFIGFFIFKLFKLIK